MATGQMSEVIRQLRRATLLRDGARLTDGQLLADYVVRRDAAALTSLVRRHGPMVWGVCRRMLRNWHDAEDAFQATFLVLVRKAASIASRELLANWLYGVAHQTALNARATAARRRTRERQVTEMPEPETAKQELWQDLQPLLDEELSRLPDKYRIPIVLCDLEGKTRKEAAQQLGCPEGTVAGRLARARGLLAKRLARRGLAVSTGTLAAALTESAAVASVLPSVVTSTIQAATWFAEKGASASAISAKVAALTEGVLKTMFLTKLEKAMAVLVIMGMLAAVASLIRLPVRADEPPQPSKAALTAARQGDNPQPALKPIVVKDGAQLVQLAWSADGKTIATLGNTTEIIKSQNNGMEFGLLTSSIKLWNGATGTLERSLGEEKDTMVQAMAFSLHTPTATMIVHKYAIDRATGEQTARPERGVRIVDAKTWELKHQFTYEDIEMTVSAIALSPDGKRLALVGSPFGSSVNVPIPQPGDEPPGCLKLWDLEKHQVIERKPKQGDQPLKIMHCLAFSPDGKLLAAGDRDGKVRLFDAETGDHKAVLDEHRGSVMRVAFSPDGKTLVSASSDIRIGDKLVESDNTVKLWDVQEGKPRWTLKRNKLWSVAFSPDGKLLATTGGFVREKDKWEYEVVLWDAKTGELKRTLATDLSVPAFALAFSPDSKSLAIAGGHLGEVKDGGKTSGEISLVRLE